MNIRRLRRIAHKTSVYLGDVQAVKRNRVPERVANRVIGRAVSRLMKGVWR